MCPDRDATSLSDSPSAVNNTPAVENTVAIPPFRARSEARMRVVYDKNLSRGARLLYVTLDDYAGMKATAWPHQATLAERLGVSIREIQRWLKELAGYIERERVRYGSRYRLLWPLSGPAPALRRDMGVATAPTPAPARADTPVASAPARHDRNVASPPSRCDNAVASDTTPASCGKLPESEGSVESAADCAPRAAAEPAQEPESVGEPESIDRPADEEPVDNPPAENPQARTEAEPTREEKLTWMYEVLTEYPGALRRIGYWPDPRIVRDCLEAGRWDTRAICRAIRETYLRGGRRAMPSESWAWFRTVLQNYFALPAGAN